MRSVLTFASCVALVGSCFVAAGCANSRRVARSSASPATTVRLARRASARSTTPRSAANRTVTSHPDAYAAPTWVEVPSTRTVNSARAVDGMVYVPELGTTVLDPCGIADSEHEWIDVTRRPSGSATDAVWMPEAYELPPIECAPVKPRCEPCCPPTTGCFDPCANGACDVPGGCCPGGQCGLPE